MISYKTEAEFKSSLKESRQRYDVFKERILPTFIINVLKREGISVGYVNVIYCPFPDLYISLIINALLDSGKLDFVVMSVDVLALDEFLDLYSELKQNHNLKEFTK